MSAALSLGGPTGAIAAAPGQRMLPHRGERIAPSPAEAGLDAPLIGPGARQAPTPGCVSEAGPIAAEAPLSVRPYRWPADVTVGRSTLKLVMRLGAATALHVGVVAALILGPADETHRFAGSGGREVALYVELGGGMSALDAMQATAASAAQVPAGEAETVSQGELAPAESPTAKPVEAKPEKSLDVERAVQLPPTEVKAAPIKEVKARDVEPTPKKKAVVKQIPMTPREKKSKVVATEVMSKPAVDHAKPAEPPASAAPAAAPADHPEPGAGGPVARPTQLASLSGSEEASPAKDGVASPGAPAPSARPAGDPNARADYVALLQAWLERYKDYPRRAQMRNQEGTALLFVAINGDGHVLEYRVARSTGFDLLDDAAREMIERALPLPKVPASLSGARLEFLVPVRFALR